MPTKARDEIDARLIAAGWSVQPSKAIDYGAARGIAVREYQTSVGPADYAPVILSPARARCITRSVKTVSQPLDTKPSIPFRDLAMGVMMGATDEDKHVTEHRQTGRLYALPMPFEDDR